MGPVLIIAAVLLFLPFVYVLVQYNGLVSLRNHISDAWANIDTELKRRHELIPNLVSTVKGYAKHEKEVVERVVQLRKQCMDAGSFSNERTGAESQLDSALKRLLITVEAYPDLKADRNFLQLQEELANTENRIQAARRFYNGNVRDYRNKCESIPSNMVAGLFGFESRDYFRAGEDEREVVEIGFSQDS